MIVEDVRLDGVNYGEETCRISEELDPPQLENSLREVGQLNPVVLIRRDSGGMMVVCGFRRLRALLRMGCATALARVLPAGSLPLLEAVRLALWDNLSHRQLNPLETARALFTLRHTCGLPEDAILGSYMPALGLPPYPQILRSYLGLHSLNPQLRSQFGEGRLTLATVEHLSSRPAAYQEVFASAAAGIRLTASLQRQVLQLVDELAKRAGCPEEEVLRQPEVLTILASAGLAPHERGQKMHDFLYRQRFPRISAAEDRFAAARAGILLPGDIHLHHDRYFETPAIRVAFQADSAARFRALAAVLGSAAHSPEIDTLFQIG